MFMKIQAVNIKTGKKEDLFYNKKDDIYRNNKGKAFNVKYRKSTGEAVAFRAPESDKKTVSGGAIVLIILIILVVLAGAFILLFKTNIIIDHTADRTGQQQDQHEQQQIENDTEFQEDYESDIKTSVPAPVDYNGKTAAISNAELYQEFSDNTYTLYCRVTVDASSLTDDEFDKFCKEDIRADSYVDCAANNYNNDTLAHIGKIYDAAKKEIAYYFVSADPSHPVSRNSFNNSSVSVRLTVKQSDRSEKYVQLNIDDAGTITGVTLMDQQTADNFNGFYNRYRSFINSNY